MNMKQIWLVGLMSVCVWLLSASQTLKSKMYEIEIWQNDHVVAIENGEVKLAKSPFQVRVKLKKGQDGVYMNASFSPDMYYQLADSEPIPDFQYISLKVFAEAPFNEDRELFIDHESFAYLFYDAEVEFNRFDKEGLKVGKKAVEGIKSVDRLFLVDDKSKKSLQENDLPIYLFFIATKKKENSKMPIDLGRQKLKIVWK